MIMMRNVRDNTLKHRSITHLFVSRIILLIALTGTILCGCAVGPVFRRPDAPTVTTYTATALPDQTVSAPVAGGEVQRFVFKKEIAEKWWMLFHSEALDTLIRRALADSPSLAAAQATLRQAQENRRAAYGTFLPSVDASASASRQQISGASSSQANVSISPFNLYNASVAISYTLDVFGGTRRELEALQAQVDYQQFQLEGAYLTLTSNIVTTVVREAALRAQIQATQEIVSVQNDQLERVEQQFTFGGVALADVLAQRAQLAQAKATIPPLEKDLAQTRHQLAVLTGRFPSEALLPEFNLGTLKLPQELPVSLPSSLVRQRPDIRAAESLLQAASAQVGVATANLYPRITLTGGYGTEALKTGDLFTGSSVIWSIGGQLLQPVFHGGALSAKRRAAVAAYDQAAAQYRETVLLAFRNVADVLKALEADARILEAQALAAKAAQETLDLTDKQFKLGAVSYLALLNAQRQYQQTRIGLVQAQALRFADTAALFQALGGGWWNQGTQIVTLPITHGE